MTVLIAANDVCFKRNGRDILQKVSMQLHANEILTIIGPNGAGKTSLVRMLIGLQQPDSGSIKYPQPLRFGYMPQKLKLNENMPLPVSSFLDVAGVDEEVLEQTLEELNIKSIYQQSMHSLSGGERQRVLLARAIFVSFTQTSI